MVGTLPGFSRAANMRAFVLLVLGFAAVAAVSSNPQKIVGGETITISQYPQITSLLYSSNWANWWQLCGGVIINSRSVLTAAHCVDGDHVSRWRVRVGSSFANSNGTVHLLQTIITHSQYNIGTRFNNDIAILRTAAEIAYENNAVQPATFAGFTYNAGDNAIVWAAGWGAATFAGILSETLRHVQVWTINQNTCVERYNAIGRTINENMLCSGNINGGGRDQCQGDNGGPLYHNNVVIGIYSWAEFCGDARYPGVNTRLSQYSSWIQANA